MRRWRFFEAVPLKPSPDERLRNIRALAEATLWDYVTPSQDVVTHTLLAIIDEAEGER